MSSTGVPVTTAASSSDNTATLTATAPTQTSSQPSAAHSAPQNPVQTAPLASASETRLFLAISQLKQMSRDFRSQQQADGVYDIRVAQIESWLDAHRDDIDARIDGPARFIGSGLQPAQSARLRHLLQPYRVPAAFLAPEQPDTPEPSESKRPRSDSPPRSNKKGKGPVKNTAGKGKDQPSMDGKSLRDCPAVVRDDEGQYVKLRCRSCDTNTTKDSASFLRGITGFQRHYSSNHGENLSMAQVYSRHGHRTFTEDEAIRMNQPGGITIVKRRARSEAEGEAGPSHTGGAGETEAGEAAEGDEAAEEDDDEEYNHSEDE